jgi:hypothetical protein
VGFRRIRSSGRGGRRLRRSVGCKLPRGTIKTETTSPSSGLRGPGARTLDHEHSRARFGIVRGINNRELDNNRDF